MYQMMCSKALRDTDGQQPNTASTSDVQYLAGLQSAAAIQNLGVKAATQNSRDKAMAELLTWLQKSAPGRTLETCLPENIVVYLVTWWCLEHGGCNAADGSRFAAPVSLEALCSHLAVQFDKQGRARDWSPDSFTGEQPAFLWSLAPVQPCTAGHSYNPCCWCREPSEECSSTELQERLWQACS